LRNKQNPTARTEALIELIGYTNSYWGAVRLGWQCCDTPRMCAAEWAGDSIGRIPAKKFEAPTLIIHGDDDQVVPIGASALLSSKLVKGATLKIHKGAPHGRARPKRIRSARICSRSSRRERSSDAAAHTERRSKMADNSYTRNRTALLFVDPHNDFLSDGGKLWPLIEGVAKELGLLDNLRTINAKGGFEKATAAPVLPFLDKLSSPT